MNNTPIRLITFNNESLPNFFYASCKRKIRNSPTHWHDFYEIHLIVSGTVNERINGFSKEMGPGWIYFLRPYDIHEYWCKEPVTMYKIQFLSNILDDDLQKLIMSRQYRLIKKLSDQEMDDMVPLFARVVEEHNSNRSNSMKMIRHLMNCIAVEMLRLCDQQSIASTSSDSIFAAIEYIHSNYTKNITMQQVASFVGLTPTYFCSKFHKEIGQSFKQYLRELQLNHAATLLQISDNSISNICSACGINSMTHFLKDFKAFYGMTPTQYRNKFRQGIR